MPLEGESEAIHHNAEVFAGRGRLGREFLAACENAPLHGGLQFVDLLVDPLRGRVVEVLPHDPTRRFERTASSALGCGPTPRSLSMEHPQAVPVIALVDLRRGCRVVDVSAGGWLVGWPLDCIRSAAQLGAVMERSRAA